METTTLTTPAGHIVTFKSHFTFGDSRQLQRVWASGMVIKPGGTTNDSIIKGNVIYEAQDTAVKLLVVKIESKEGLTFEGDPDKILEVIFSMPEEDGKAIYAKIDELTRANTLTPDAKKN